MNAKYARWEEPPLNERPELLTELHEKYKKLDRPDARPVRLTVLRNDFEIGSDMGLVDFVDGSIRYDGLRTEFQLGRQSITVINEPLFGLTRTLRIGAAEDQHEIILKPIDKLDPDNYYSIVGVYKQGLKGWLDSKAIGDNEIYPPIITPYRTDVKPGPGRNDNAAGLLGATSVSVLVALRAGFTLLSVSILVIGACLAAFLFRKRRQYFAKCFEEQLVDTALIDQLQRNEEGE